MGRAALETRRPAGQQSSPHTRSSAAGQSSPAAAACSQSPGADDQAGTWSADWLPAEAAGCMVLHIDAETCSPVKCIAAAGAASLKVARLVASCAALETSRPAGQQCALHSRRFSAGRQLQLLPAARALVAVLSCARQARGQQIAAVQCSQSVCSPDLLQMHWHASANSHSSCRPAEVVRLHLSMLYSRPAASLR